jgi:hypothetical protein
MSQIYLFNLIRLNIGVNYIYTLLKKSSFMASDFSKAKEPELKGTLGGTSPGGAEVLTESHTLNKRRHSNYSGYRD